MNRLRYALLVLRAFGGLLRFELIHCVLGFRYVYRDVERLGVADALDCAVTKEEICDAVALAACLYWKRVYCLQRSAVAVRLMRMSGIPGTLVIGYRPSPFFSHAWAEVNGRVVNDSPVYKERLHVLCTL